MNRKDGSRTILWKYLGLLLLIPILLLSGCTMHDKDYSIAEEQYLMGWILHNVNDSTSTILNYSLDELAIYNYTFNYPSSKPETYSNILFWLSPVPKNGGGFGAASWTEIDVPLHRVYYLKGENPVPENYVTNWSFSNYMHINYLKSENFDEQMVYELAHLEHYRSEDAFEAITPIPGESKNVFFGTAPFIPTSITIENGYLKLNNHLMRGYGGNSYLIRETEISIYDLTTGNETTVYLQTPRYEVYLNGTLILNGNLTSGGVWDYRSLYFNLSKDGNYLVNLSIPTDYPVWNMTIITAQFHKPSADMNPPVLNKIEIPPKFSINETIPIKINITDDSELRNISVYYRFNGERNWKELPITFDQFFNTSLLVDNETVEKISLRIFAEDIYGNNISYTIIPVSLKGINVSFSLSSEKISFKRGETIYVSGSCYDEYNSECGGFRIKYFLNDEYLGADRIEFSYPQAFTKSFKIPYNLSSNKANFSVVFEGTGRYQRGYGILPLNITTFDHDLAIDDFTISLSKLNQTSNISAIVYNIGKNNESEIEVELFINEELKENVSITRLDSLNSKEINFTWVPEEPAIYNVSVFVKPVVGEEDKVDNYVEKFVKIGPDVRAEIVYEWGKRIVSNHTTTINTIVENIGTEDAINVSANLLDLLENSTIDSLFIGNLSAGEVRNIQFNWTPSLVGMHDISFIVNSSKDADPSNNEYLWFFKVLPDAPDVKGHFYIFAPSFLKDQTIYLDIYIENEGGRDANNVSAELYDILPNGTTVKIWGKEIEHLSPADEWMSYVWESEEWVPGVAGTHVVKLTISCDNDWNETNNFFNQSISIQETGTSSTTTSTSTTSTTTVVTTVLTTTSTSTTTSSTSTTTIPPQTSSSTTIKTTTTTIVQKKRSWIARYWYVFVILVIIIIITLLILLKSTFLLEKLREEEKFKKLKKKWGK